MSEVERGIESPSMGGKSNGRSNYPNFGKHTSNNYFKAFDSEAPCYFAHKKA